MVETTPAPPTSAAEIKAYDQGERKLDKLEAVLAMGTARVAAVERVRDLFDLRAATNLGEGTAGGYVFPYDPTTLAELDAAADSGPGEEPRR